MGSRYYDINAFAEIEAVIDDNREDNKTLEISTQGLPTYLIVTPNARINTTEHMANEVDILLEHGISLERLSQDKRLYWGFIDYWKAFDSVNCIYLGRNCSTKI